MSKNEHEQLVKQLKDQILITGSQVKQKMKTIQLDLLATLEEEQNGHDQHKGNTLF